MRLGCLPLYCLQLVFGLVQVEVEEQDLSLPSSSGQGLFSTGQCPFSPISVCWVAQVQKHEYRKSIREFWSGCSSTVWLCSFREGCWPLRSVERRTEEVVNDKMVTQFNVSWVVCRPVTL